MNPGIELDKLIAEKIMGFEYCDLTVTAEHGLVIGPGFLPGKKETSTYKGKILINKDNPSLVMPSYSTSIADAWTVVEKLQRWKFTLTWEYDFGGGGRDPKPYASAIFNPVWEDQKEELFAEAETAPHAICLAALRALGVEVP